MVDDDDKHIELLTIKYSTLFNGVKPVVLTDQLTPLPLTSPFDSDHFLYSLPPFTSIINLSQLKFFIFFLGSLFTTLRFWFHNGNFTLFALLGYSLASFEDSAFTMSAGATNQFISVSPPELKFQFELGKQSYCDLKVANSTDQCVAFKVKTTSPKKYFVRPNTGIIQPWDSAFIRVTLQAQKEYPPDMQCKDKFLLQSTIVNNDIDELPPDTFNKDGGRTVEECKLRVVYMSSHSSPGPYEDVFRQSSDFTSNQALQRIKDERDAAVRQTQQLLQDLEMMKRRRNRNDPGFSLRFAIVVGVIGLMVGFLLKLLSSPSVE